MTMFGMPPDDPEGLMPGIDGSIGFGDQGENLTDSDEVEEKDEDGRGQRGVPHNP